MSNQLNIASREKTKCCYVRFDDIDSTPQNKVANTLLNSAVLVLIAEEQTASCEGYCHGDKAQRTEAKFSAAPHRPVLALSLQEE